jgi:NADPH2:quinone reductase
MNTHDLTPMHLKGLTLHLIFMLLPMLTGEGRQRHGEIMQRVATWVDAGKLEPLVHAERFRFDQANEAHALFASGTYVGKIVLERA